MMTMLAPRAWRARSSTCRTSRSSTCRAGSTETMETGTACSPTGTNLSMKWNAHASEWGAYEITGCDGVNPKLTLAAGTTYTFDQSDASNWYHPVGFSYIAGGAHTECADGEGAMGECPELG